MKNYNSDGKVIKCVAPADGVVSGMIYKIGALIVVAAVSAAVGEEFSGVTAGVYQFDIKTPANTGTVGDKIYLTADGLNITTTATANTLIGVLAKDAVASSTDVYVRLGIVA